MPGNLPPKGHVRLNVNVPSELHRKMKMAAVVTGTTMGELMRRLMKEPLDELLRKGLK